MQASRFNISIPDVPGPGELLIFNTLSGGLFVLEPEYRQTLEKVSKGEPLDEEDQSRAAELASEGYLAPSAEFEEDKLVHHMLGAEYATPSTLQAKVLTTMSCNLACKYCFETHMERAPRMSLDTAHKVCELIMKRAEDGQVKVIEIDFYGGEPLLNQPVIEEVSRTLGEFAKEKGMEYRFTMTTNGTLLTPEVVNKLKPLGLAGARVTLDGLPQVHDARRPFRKGDGSCFQVIMNNLEQILDKLPVTLTNIYSGDDLSNTEALLDYLGEKGLLKKFKAFQVGPEMGYLDEQGKVCGSAGCNMDIDTAENFLKGLTMLFERGVKFRGDLLAASNCSLSTEGGGLLFAPEGDIFKCPMLMGQSQYAVGRVDAPDFFPRYYSDINRQKWRECPERDSCAYLPMCGTGLGCRLSALEKKQPLWGDSCTKDFMEAYVPQAMKLELYFNQGEE